MSESTYPRIDYAARDFLTLKEALLSFIEARFDDVTDFTESQSAVILLELFAWIGDMLGFTIDMAANECYLPTVRQRYNAVNIVKLIGYQPRPPASASVELLLTVAPDGFTQDATIFAKTKFIVADVTFELLQDYVLPAGNHDAGPGSDSGIDGPVFSEGVSYEETVDGTGETLQTITLDNYPVIRDSVTVSVDGTEWTGIEALIFAGDSDKYQVDYDGNNAATIRFGNGLYGRIPPSGVGNIVIGYRVGGGQKGNIAANLINTTLPAVLADGTQVSIAASNPSPASGGADEESLESIRFNAPRYVRTHGNAITKKDYDTLVAMFTDPSYGSIAKGIAMPRYGRTNSSANEVDVYVWARTNGGELTVCSLGLKQALLAYLNVRKVVVDIFINDGLLTSLDIDVKLFIAQTTRTTQSILTDARSEISAYFNRDELEPGQTFYVSELCHVLMSVQGVRQVAIGIPDTAITADDNVTSAFVVGVTTEIHLTTGELTIDRFAGGSISFTSGVQAGRSYPVLANGADTIRVDAILTSLVNGDSLMLSSKLDPMPDVPMAENEIYKLGTLNLSAYVRAKDTRESVLITEIE